MCKGYAYSLVVMPGKPIYKVKEIRVPKLVWQIFSLMEKIAKEQPQGFQKRLEKVRESV